MTRRILTAILLPLMLLAGGCLTTDYNVRAIYDTNRYYEGAYSDSTTTLMKWNTPKWKDKNVKLWASSGVIVTNPYNAFVQNSWIKDIVAAGFKGQIFVEDPLMDMVQTEYGSNPYFASTFYYNTYLIKVGLIGGTNDTGPIRTYPAMAAPLVVTNNTIFPYTTASALVLNPNAWSVSATRVSYSQAYLNAFAAATTAIEDTKGAVKWGVCLNDYTYQDWKFASQYLDSLAINPVTSKGKAFENYTPTEVETWYAPTQTYKLQMFNNAGIDVFVRGNRTASLLKTNPDLQNKLFMGQFIEDVNSTNITQVTSDIGNIRSMYGASNENTAFMFIAGIKNDVYHQASPTAFGQLAKALTNLGCYFTPGANNAYFDAPKSNPGSWWIRTANDVNWQANAPTYTNPKNGPRKIILDAGCEPRTGTTTIGLRQFDHTIFVPPSNNIRADASGDSGLIDFSFVYDENASLFHLMAIPPYGRSTIDNQRAFFMHYTSPDLINWTRLHNINLYDATYARHEVWAPHIIKVGNTWYMFYTAVKNVPTAARQVQRIMLTTSTDLTNWTTGVQSLDGNWFKSGVADFTKWEDPNLVDYSGGDCRDPFVMRNETDTGWLMFVTIRGDGAAANFGGMNNIVGIAESLDASAPIPGDRISSLTTHFQLTDWVMHTAYTDSWAESPQVWREPNGTYYMQWTTNQEDPNNPANVNPLTPPWWQGARALTTTPSKGNRQSNTWGTEAQVVTMSYKACEMISTKSGLRLVSWLDYHPYNGNGVFTDKFGMGLRTYRALPNGTDEFYNLTDPNCIEPITIMAIPETPSGLLATDGDASVTLTWNAHTTGDVWSYNIYRGTTTGPTTLLTNTHSNDNTWVDDTVTNGTRYYYVVKSVNQMGTSSDASNEVTVLPSEALPVDEDPSLADFIGTPLTGSSPLQVAFTDLSTNNPTQWWWNFGDGSAISTEQNPVHTYTSATPMYYTVSMGSKGPLDIGWQGSVKSGYVHVTTPAGFAITSVTGAVSKDATVTVAGSGFGVNGPTVVVFDDFERGTAGAAINKTPTTNGPRVGTWILGYSPLMHYSNTSPRGNLSAFTDASDGNHWYTRLQSKFTGVREIFISYWYQIPPGSIRPASTGNNWKTVWPMGTDLVYGDNRGSNGDRTLGWVANGDYWYFGGNDQRLSGWYPNPNTTFDYAMTNGYWVHNAWYMKGNTTTAAPHNGTFQFMSFSTDPAGTSAEKKMHNVLNLSNAGMLMPQNGVDGLWTAVWFNGNVGASSPNEAVEWDDCYVAIGPGCRARVEIGNNPVYTECTNLSICVPTTWTDGSITFKAYTGNFAAGPAYLFVTDEFGNVTDGYAITIS